MKKSKTTFFFLKNECSLNLKQTKKNWPKIGTVHSEYLHQAVYALVVQGKQMISLARLSGAIAVLTEVAASTVYSRNRRKNTQWKVLIQTKVRHLVMPDRQIPTQISS